jgi:hypothetical protein
MACQSDVLSFSQQCLIDWRIPPALGSGDRLGIPYLKVSETPEEFQISEFFRFWNTCIDFTQTGLNFKAVYELRILTLYYCYTQVLDERNRLTVVKKV